MGAATMSARLSIVFTFFLASLTTRVIRRSGPSVAARLQSGPGEWQRRAGLRLHSLGRFAARVPDGPLARGTAPAGPPSHVGVADVEVGDDPIVFLQAEEPAHVLVIGDRSGAPDAGEAEGVGRELHVLDGRGAGRVVLQGLDLITAGGGDHSDDHGRSEGFLALAADPTSRHLLVLPFRRGL